MQRQNRNVRVTYPDSPDGTLEIDIIQGMEISLNLTFADLKYYAKDGVLKIRQNLWANPGYRNFLFSKTAHVTLNNESPVGDNGDDHLVDLASNLTGSWVIDYHRGHK